MRSKCCAEIQREKRSGTEVQNGTDDGKSETSERKREKKRFASISYGILSFYASLSTPLFIS